MFVRKCVCERKRESLCERVCVRERERVCVRECVLQSLHVREREKCVYERVFTCESVLCV